jgi:hypothetical protein
MAGRPPAEKSFKAALDKAIAQDPQALRKAADKLLAMAADGEAWAVKELADRLDGKPAQAITGKDGGPISVILSSADQSVL